MALGRKQALKRLLGLVRQVEWHLETLAVGPNDWAAVHHRHEIRNWLRQMEEVLRHVGTKTAAEWQARIDAYWQALEQAAGEPEA